MRTSYKILIRLATWLQPVVLLLIRIVCGLAISLAGFGKFTHIDQVALFFENLAIPFPLANAYLVGTIELAGGMLLIVGLATRLAALLLTVVLLTAYFTAHYEVVVNLFVDPASFISAAPFLFLYSTLIVFAFGPGLFSLDAGIKRYLDEWTAS